MAGLATGWVATQTNCALKNSGPVEAAVELTSWHKLPLHPDRWKNWDSFLAVSHCARLTWPDDRVLDAGACRDSAFLPGLKALGYSKLTGVNLNELRPGEFVGGIRYEYGDITTLKQFPSEHFAFVACLSVIEHEVDWEKFLDEMARVIKPRGHLFVSFDYWPDAPDKANRRAGPEASTLQLFSSGEVLAFLTYASSVGFYPTSEVNCSAGEKVVHSTNEPPGSGGYTFFNLLLEHRA